MVHVATTIAPVQDGELTDQIHDDLAASGLARRGSTWSMPPT